MAQIPGTNLAAGIRPNDTQDVFDTHSAEYGRGGYHTGHTDTTARDTIPVERRHWYMVVPLHDGTKWELVPGGSSQDLADNGNWQPLLAAAFTPIAANEFGTHPAFVNQHTLNVFLLGRGDNPPTGIAPPTPTNPVTDDAANTFTYNPGGSSSPLAPTSPVVDNTANTLTYTPA